MSLLSVRYNASDWLREDLLCMSLQECLDLLIPSMIVCMLQVCNDSQPSISIDADTRTCGLQVMVAGFRVHPDCHCHDPAHVSFGTQC